MSVDARNMNTGMVTLDDVMREYRLLKYEKERRERARQLASDVTFLSEFLAKELEKARRLLRMQTH